jgi:hypothetical protein
MLLNDHHFELIPCKITAADEPSYSSPNYANIITNRFHPYIIPKSSMGYAQDPKEWAAAK